MTPALHLETPTVPGAASHGDDYLRLALDWSDCARNTVHTLPEGMRLLDYEIVGPIGEGGFGIVYLAWDHALEQHVAIKEYLPAVLASRASVSSAVVVKSQRHLDSFRVGLRSFVNEARILARFDHPSLVRVLHFWEGNGTAYMAMPYYEGPTLARALAELGRTPDEAELCGWLHPLLDALGSMHAQSCFHRDIAPDNILLTDHGPVLLDFGAARRVIDGLGPSPTVVFKPGFAPIEQYGEVASMKQGAWTDVYALAGVVYAAVTGRPPTPAIERLMDDQLQPLSELARGRYSEHFLAAVDAALSLHPRNRPQSAAEFWARLTCAERLDDLDLVRAVRRCEAPERAAAPAAEMAEHGETDEGVEGVEGVGSIEGPEDIEVDAAPLATFRRAVPTVEETASRIPPWQFVALTRRMLPSATPARPGRTKAIVVVALLLLLGLVAVGYRRIGAPVPVSSPTPPAPSAMRAPSPSPAPVAVAPAPMPLPVPMPAPASASTLPKAPPAPEVAATAPSEAQPNLASPWSSFDTPDARPSRDPLPAPQRAQAPAASPRASRREARAASIEAPPRPAIAAVVAAEPGQVGGRCTEILQRASLEALTPGEAAFLRKECER